jgi:diguanylate cyclase (GGDEF)-like protein
LLVDDTAFDATIRLTRSPYYRWFVLIGTALVLSLLAAALALILMQRNAAIEGQRTALNHLGNAVFQQTSQLIDSADQVIRAIEDDLTPAGDATPEWVRLAIRGHASADLMNSLIKGSPLITGLAVADADGVVRNWSGQWGSSAYNLADRDLFKHFSATDDRGTYVSAPAKSDLNGKWSAFLSRRINNVDGTFAGVAVAAISLEVIENAYYHTLPPGRTVSLVHIDGSILIRFPHRERYIGQKIPFRAAWNEAVARDGNTYLSEDFFAPTRILAFVRPLGTVPLVVHVAVPEDELPAAWLLPLACALAGAAAALVGVIMLSRYLARQIDRVERSRLALARNNAELETARFQLHVALANIPLGVVFFNGDGRLILSNDRYREIYNLPVEATRPGTHGHTVMDYVFASDRAPRLERDTYISARDAMTARGGRQEMVVELTGGQSVLIIHQAMADGGWLSTHEDITERRRADSHIRFLAHNDVLTNLSNRASFTERLDEAMTSQRQSGEQLAVFMMDLDGFKHINDTLGHVAGDHLLRETAMRLKSSIRDSDVLARLGGDEFAVIQMGAQGSPERAASLAARMVAVMSEPFNIDGKTVSVGASIGIALASEHASVSSDLLRMADLALYAVKNSGRNNFCFFQDEMLATYNERHELEYQLRLAIARDEFELHYQALVDVNTGRRDGFEALVRWNRPGSGRVAPDKFIPLAEETGLIVPLGEWILRRACADAVHWPAHIKVAVNLSPVQLAHPGLFESIQRALAETSLPAGRLELEITETALFKNNADCETVIRKLKELGISIALDDFGTGYSSLSYLTMIPFDKIKIDRSFTMKMTERADCAAIVAAIVALAHNLNAQTVAEGVETEEHLAILRAAGVTLVQGYLFSKPCPASALVLDDISKQHLFASAA